MKCSTPLLPVRPTLTHGLESLCVWLCVLGDRAKLRPHRVVVSDCQFWTVVAQPSVGTSGMEESVFYAGGHGDSLGEQLRPSRVIRVCVCNMNTCYTSICRLRGVCVVGD